MALVVEEEEQLELQSSERRAGSSLAPRCRLLATASRSTEERELRESESRSILLRKERVRMAGRCAVTNHMFAITTNGYI